ncbi:MAG: hypothetical protein C5B55_09700 [Blastocatellia bacterium]|nr:MAG: hypothetical protein C5B55_09700 [Blastocatellia bacterium]
MGSNLIGIIPAAGMGTRLGQLGNVLPKALLEVEGKSLLDHSLKLLESIGLTRAIIVVGHLESAIREHLSTIDSNLEITFVRQEKPLGLAHAIWCASSQIDADFVVLCPDNLYTEAQDLIDARERFARYEPAFLLLVTTEPSQQRDRRSYKICARKSPAANLFEYEESRPVDGGLELFSTGCVFLQKEALKFLPDFSQATEEHKFRDYLQDISRESVSLIHLLRGMRYDFSSPEDVQDFAQLQKRLSTTFGRGVSAILINEFGEILLQQRDDNPAIRYPGYWSLFGGTVEDSESPFAAVVREVEEEINFRLRNVGLFREFVQNNKREFAFAGEITARIDELTLSEGQGMKFFSPAELFELQIRPDDRETLENYFGVKHD